ncbi:SDR family oxidoreductase [Rheinheimera metallidurans]|uniref:UDP-glucose 4-epimerase family protein n=1 Tax=Rheinheimera metallidurans TaxID=2925781 RepID=UPI003001E3AD
MIKNVVITGANGFVGTALLREAQRLGYCTTAVTRSPLAFGFAAHNILLSQLDANTDWCSLLVEAKPDVVIHTAARVHQMNDSAEDPMQAFRAVNTAGTLNLARQAAALGVKRFIFISSVKVNGEQTLTDNIFNASHQPNPIDPYGISKAEAEAGLRSIAEQTNMEVVIIRPPLVYGQGVKGNFSSMMHLAEKNYPLPLGAIHNKRSLVALDNLLDLIITCINHPKAANQTFLVSDDQDISTTELLQMMTLAAGKNPWLIPVPMSWLQLAGKLTGKQAVIDRLCGNLQVDISHTKETLGWMPPITVEEGIKRCFIEEKLC